MCLLADKVTGVSTRGITSTQLPVGRLRLKPLADQYPIMGRKLYQVQAKNPRRVLLCRPGRCLSTIIHILGGSWVNRARTNKQVLH